MIQLIISAGNFYKPIVGNGKFILGHNSINNAYPAGILPSVWTFHQMPGDISVIIRSGYIEQRIFQRNKKSPYKGTPGDGTFCRDSSFHRSDFTWFLQLFIAPPENL